MTPSGHEVQLPEEIFRENPALERAEITYPRTFIERDTFSHLDDLKELLLLNSSSSDPVKFPELVISKKSPCTSPSGPGKQGPAGTCWPKRPTTDRYRRLTSTSDFDVSMTLR